MAVKATANFDSADATLNQFATTGQMPLHLNTTPTQFYPSAAQRTKKLSRMRTVRQAHHSLGGPLSIPLIKDFFPTKPKIFEIFEDDSAGYVGILSPEERKRQEKEQEQQERNKNTAEAVRRARLLYQHRQRRGHNPPVVGRGRPQPHTTQAEREVPVEAFVDADEEEAFQERSARRRQAWETGDQEGVRLEDEIGEADIVEDIIMIFGQDIRTMGAEEMDAALEGRDGAVEDMVGDAEFSDLEDGTDTGLDSLFSENTPPSLYSSPPRDATLSIFDSVEQEVFARYSQQTLWGSPRSCGVYGYSSDMHRGWRTYEKCPAELLQRRNASVRMR